MQKINKISRVLLVIHQWWRVHHCEHKSGPKSENRIQNAYRIGSTSLAVPLRVPRCFWESTSLSFGLILKCRMNARLAKCWLINCPRAPCYGAHCYGAHCYGVRRSPRAAKVGLTFDQSQSKLVASTGPVHLPGSWSRRVNLQLVRYNWLQAIAY